MLVPPRIGPPVFSLPRHTMPLAPNAPLILKCLIGGLGGIIGGAGTAKVADVHVEFPQNPLGIRNAQFVRQAVEDLAHGPEVYRDAIRLLTTGRCKYALFTVHDSRLSVLPDPAASGQFQNRNRSRRGFHAPCRLWRCRLP